MVWIVLPIMLAGLKRRLDEHDRRVSPPRHDEQIDELLKRVARLEALLQERTEQPARPDITPQASPEPTVRAPALHPMPAVVPAPLPFPVATPIPVPAPPQMRSADEWEVAVGTSWLNRLGVIVFVIGVALLVGYSMVHVGAAGRVAIGYALSIGMLAGGVALERRDTYRSYAHGLIGGGWAGIYFTTYAMRAVPAARVLDSDLTAVILLLAVAGGMIAHSLRFRSETVTALAYIAAYAALLLTPLSGFSLAAAVPLTASLVIVALRLGWSSISVLGVISTYGLFVLRHGLFGDSSEDPTPLARYLTLSAYWIIFETADIVGLRTRPPESRARLFALNAAGYIGAVLLELTPNDPALVSDVLAASGAAYLVSAMVRAKLLEPPADVESSISQAAGGTVHGAIAVAAGLVAWSVDLRFAGNRETLALLLEAELLFAAGVALADRRIRLTGAGIAALTTLYHLSVLSVERSTAGLAAGALLPRGFRASTVVAVLVCLVWYVNRESLRRSRLVADPVESGYTWAALALWAGVIGNELQPEHQGLAGVILAAALLEAGRRGVAEYRYQAYVAGTYGALSTLSLFLYGPRLSSTTDAWIVLTTAAVLAYGLVWRLSRATSGMSSQESRTAAGIAMAFGTAFLVVLEWRVLERAALSAAWAATAAALLAASVWPAARGLRWHASVVFGLAAFGLLEVLAGPIQATTAEIGWMLFTIGVFYAASLASRRAIRREAGADDTTMTWAEACRVGLSVTATVLLTALVLNQIRPTLVTVAWGLEGAVLLAVGFPTRERVLRLSGLALLLLCVVKLFVLDLSELEALSRILSFVVLGLVLLGVSWTYTRFREQIRKFL
jgi:hypothetical protein